MGVTVQVCLSGRVRECSGGAALIGTVVCLGVCACLCVCGHVAVFVCDCVGEGSLH